MDWDNFYTALLYPGPMLSGISRQDIFNLTWPECLALFKHFKEFSSNEDSNKNKPLVGNSGYDAWYEMWKKERVKHLGKDNG